LRDKGDQIAPGAYPVSSQEWIILVTGLTIVSIFP